MIKPTKVLCKRSLTIGDPFWVDESFMPPKKFERDNRMLVKGVWYDVIYNPNDTWNERDKTFTIIDNQNNPHLFYMYEEEDKSQWPSFCKDYGPRDYAKWFYTPKELELKTLRETKKQFANIIYY